MSDIEKARRGDRAAFGRLAATAQPKVRAFLWRMVGHPEDCEDLLQVTLTRAWEGIGKYNGKAAFSTWVISIARNAAIDFLRKKGRWRRESQIAYANLCTQDEAWQTEIADAMTEPDFEFDAKEHIAYCFVCIGRSLPPDEQAALVLRDVMEFSNREAADIVGSSESVLRHRLSAARTAMKDRYAGLCALVSKNGICHQCAGLGIAAESLGAKKTSLPDIDTFARRLEVVRSQDLEKRRNRSLHDVFFRRCSKIESNGMGSTEPNSDCREGSDAVLERRNR